MDREELRRLREAVHVSRGDLATRLGASEPMLQRIEDGRKPVPEGFPAQMLHALDGIMRERRETVLSAMGIGPPNDLGERLFLVTHPTGALGRALVPELLEAGGRVLAAGSVEREWESLAAELPQHADNLRGCRLDLDAPHGFDAALRALEQDYGRLDGLVHLAGGHAAGGPPERRFDRTLVTMFRLFEAAIPRLRENGGGKLLCVADWPSDASAASRAPRAAARAALLGMVEAMAEELWGENIQVNCLLAGAVDADPARVARVVRFLVSAEGGVISGAMIPLGGA